MLSAELSRRGNKVALLDVGGVAQRRGRYDPSSGAPPRPIDLALDFSLQGGSGTSHILLWTNLRVATSLLSPLARSKEPPPPACPTAKITFQWRVEE